MKAQNIKFYSVLSVLLAATGIASGYFLLRPVSGEASLSSEYQTNSCMPSDSQKPTIQGPLSANPVTNTALPIPADVRVVGDDRRARLVWDNGGSPDVTLWSAAKYVNDVRMGYYVEVTDKDTGALVKEAVTIHREIDIQPLTNGHNYQARIFSVDGLGRVSLPSNPVTVRPDAERITRLRALCTGFFDDFNLSAGAFDELKWNFAVGINNGPKHNGSFINAQFHAHSSVSTEEKEDDFYNDRSRVFSRPRALFDISNNRKGRILFSLDGTRGGRDIWYLDLYPSNIHNGRLDANGREQSFTPTMGEVTKAYPGNFVRVSSSGNSVSVDVYGQGGKIIGGFSGQEYTNYPTRNFANVSYVPNVQKQWEVEVSRTHIDIYIDGHWVMGGPLSLGAEYNRIQLGWVVFSYNTAKDNENRVQLAHWDNFCFDGPKVSTDVVHDYKHANTSVGGADRIDGHLQPIINLKIPDSIAGAKSAYLNFILHPYGYSHYDGWSASQSVIVNGTKINFPDPYQTYLSAGMLPLTGSGQDLYDQFIGGNIQFPVQVAVPLSALKTGDNSIQFNIPVTINNIHLELDFAAGSEPSYTQPSAIFNTAYTPKLWDHGPRTQFVSINSMSDFQVKPNYDADWKFINFSYVWTGGSGNEVPMRTGVNEIVVRADLEPMIISTGVNPGLYDAKLLIDNQVVQTISLQAAVPAPMSYIRFKPDLTSYKDGQSHKFAVVVTSAQINPATGARYEGYATSLAEFGFHCGIDNVAQYGANNPAFTFRVQ